MRVLMISKACVVGIYQRKLEEIARSGVELLTLVPPSWRDERGELMLERAFTDGYRLETTPIRFNGNFHLHYYPDLGRRIRAFAPDIVHIDEEPYNLAAWHALVHTRRAGAKSVLFSWQNILRTYPFPFSAGERWTLNRADCLIAGTDSAAEVWRAKGYRGPLPTIPQFGVDPVLFAPESEARTTADAGVERPFTIGYVGRLIAEKGIDDLLNAAARLHGRWRVVLIGGGPLRDDLTALAATLGISYRVEFREQIPSTRMPAQYHDLDALVLPSRTQANWKEQFGRVLIEAMASGVPVVGSDSGAIPDVVGDAGRIFPEGDVTALARHLSVLQTDAGLRADLARRGRARVVANYTHQAVAAATVEVYRQIARSTCGDAMG